MYYSEIIDYDISVLEFIGVSITYVLHGPFIEMSFVLNILLYLVQVFSFCWLILPFRERNNFIRIS